MVEDDSRRRPVAAPERHFVTGGPIVSGPGEAGPLLAMFAMGCFWGAEKAMWQAAGVDSTAVGYAGGRTPNPSYHEVCSGRTGHAEVVLVAYDAAAAGYDDLLKVFWECHDPTQGMRQGNDVGTQYRSGIYYYSEAQARTARASRAAYQARISEAGFGEITTEIAAAPRFFFAEEYHQQYLAKNPDGHCGARGVGIPYANGLIAAG